MTLRYAFLACALLITVAACRKKPQDRLLVYIMAGQSNMAGRGQISPGDTVSDPRIFTIDADRNMVVAREPLHVDHPGFEGLDCGMSFARALLEQAPAGTRICLVPVARSSTSVQEWLGDSLRGLRIFTNAVTRAGAAIAAGGEVAGILWHQGESNAESGPGVSGYRQCLDSLVHNFRAAFARPDMPFFAATLADFCARPFKDSVNAGIVRLAHETPRFVLVPAYDLSSKADKVHFDADAQRELGRRFAKAAAEYL